MNLAIRGIDAKIELGDTLMNDKFPELKVDYVIANPPFNVSDYNINKAETHKWKYGVPPTGNANYAWLQHFISKLAPFGTAGVVLANGSMSSETATEGQIRRELIENDLVDCMVSLPSQLFYNTQIPACLWFLARNKEGTAFPSSAGRGGLRNRTHEILFIDARELGTMISRKQKELSDKDIAKISDTYHNWRKLPPRSATTPPKEGNEYTDWSHKATSEEMSATTPPKEGNEYTDWSHKAISKEMSATTPPKEGNEYEDIAGFCKSATIDDVRKNNYILTPGRYIDFKEVADDGVAFEDKMQTLTATLATQMQKAGALDEAIRLNLQKIGYTL